MRFGLIGAGCIGRLRAEALRKTPRTRLVAVTDLDRALSSRIAVPIHARVCSGLDEMLHAGKQVLCEKPLSKAVNDNRWLTIPLIRGKADAVYSIVIQCKRLHL